MRKLYGLLLWKLHKELNHWSMPSENHGKMNLVCLLTLHLFHLVKESRLEMTPPDHDRI